MKKTLLATAALAAVAGVALLLSQHARNTPAPETSTMTTSAIISAIDAFVAAQNQNRGGTMANGATLPFDYDALTGTVPAGGNTVTGVAGITSGAATITLPTGALGDAVIIDGAVSTTASTSTVHSYSFTVDATGTATLTDNNTGFAQTITGAEYLVFDSGATVANGAYQSIYMIESGTNAQIAAMYNAAFGRQPDLAGLEFYANPVGNGAMTLHQAATYFLASPEFAKLYPALAAPADNGGPNDQAFITQLYGQILSRTPTAAEVNYYVQALQGTLTTSSGATIPAADRAQLLIYFAISPENQKDISGWLINPANGTVNFGAMTPAVGQSILSSEVATGTVNLSDFTGLATSADQIQIINAVGSVNIQGSHYTIGGMSIAGADISVSLPNITVNLSAAINIAYVSGKNDTVNGAPTGGSLVAMPDTVADAQYPSFQQYSNNGGTVNFFGNANTIWSGTFNTSGVNTPSMVNGWNSTDVVHFAGDSDRAGTAFSASAASPLSGSGINFSGTRVAINVGHVADDSVTTMLSAINAAYQVGEVTGENAYFFGQTASGNTIIYHWKGDTTHIGHVIAADINGAVELVGVQANSLTSTNFH